MGNSAPVPPGDGQDSDDEDLDELEMTSVMDGAQARELRRAARLAHEGERETARPIAALAIATPVAIPRAAAVPAEALPTPPQAWSASGPPKAMPSTLWFVLAFVLLAATVAFELR